MVDPVRVVLNHALIGRSSHVSPSRALEGMDWQTAGMQVPHAPHTVGQILQHVLYWQDLILAAARGEEAAWPKQAVEGWSASPCPLDEQAWISCLERFLAGLKEAEEMSLQPEVNLEQAIPAWKDGHVYDAVQSLASHNSYHLGQIVQLRIMLGAWPPPSGGDTW